MKYLIILIALILLTTAAQAQENETQINISGLRSNEGTVMLTLYNAEGKTLEVRQAKISNQTCNFAMKLEADSQYAISYIHDENANGKLDAGTFGIPQEGYGFSNNARGFMGPPSFEDQLFEGGNKDVLRLTTKYH